MMMNMILMIFMVLINYEIASITGCASFVLACFCFVFCVCSFQPLQYFFFSFVLSFFFFLSLLSLFLRLLLIPPHQIQSTPQGINRSSDSHTHIRKINSHSRLLKVKISSGVVWGIAELGFATSVVGSHCSLLICSLLNAGFIILSLRSQSLVVTWIGPVPLQPHRTTRLVLAGPLHIIPLGK